MPDVPGVLLDEVHDDAAHRPRLARDEGLADVGVLLVDLSAVRDLATPRLPGLRDAALGADRRVEVEVGLLLGPVEDGQGRLSLDRPTEQWCSILARWRTSPSRLIVLGGTERVASCAGVRPSHFISKVVR